MFERNTTSLSSLSWRSWNVLTRFSCPSLSMWDGFGGSPAHIYIVLKYSDLTSDMIHEYLLTAVGLTAGGNLTQIKFPRCQQLHGLWFFCFRGQVPAFNSLFRPFCSSVGVPNLRCVRQRSHRFWTWKNQSRTCVLPILYSPKSTFNF